MYDETGVVGDSASGRFPPQPLLALSLLFFTVGSDSCAAASQNTPLSVVLRLTTLAPQIDNSYFDGLSQLAKARPFPWLATGACFPSFAASRSAVLHVSP